ncbi:Uncharacterised protein (plasmid) [Klebsiella aerogenes]|nr:Uncharacterised protein [Klebsiella aerogenes]
MPHLPPFKCLLFSAALALLAIAPLRRKKNLKSLPPSP